MLEALVNEIVADLTDELDTDDNFSETLLRSKVKGAVREVRLARRYPNCPESFIEGDMENYYPVIRKIALYDYNQIGSEFENSHSENGISRSYKNRDSLFSGVIPIGGIV